ncbi:MAG: SDR family NAD(P)-dependent oxidoreductase, partial [Dehalococcoidales bacterium]
MEKLEDKVAIVTGAARGNGEGVVRVMARKGATVVLTDVLDLVHKTAKSISDSGYKAVSLKMDITKPAEVDHVVQKVLEQFGKIDILVNNAGVL